MKREIDKFSKRIKNSETASYNSIESINPKSDLWSLIPMTTKLNFPTPSSCNFVSSHPPNENKIFSNYSGQQRL